MITVHATSFAGQAVDIVVSNAVAHSEFKQTTLCVARANQSVSGDGFIARVMTDPTLLPITVGQVSIPPSGGTDEQSLSTVRAPDTGAAAVTASTSSSKSTGTIGVTSKASTYAHAEDVCVLRDTLGVCTVSATVVQSQSNSEAKKTGAASDDAGTQLLGLRIAGVAQSASPPRNTTVTLPGIGFVILNEQFCDGSVDIVTKPTCADGTGHTGLTVRAIHVKVTVPANPLGLTPGAEVIVAEAHSDATYR